MASDIQAVAADAPIQPASLSRLSSIPWHSLFAGGTVVVLGAAASNGLSFLFSFWMARVLRPEDFATLTACMSLLVVVTIPGATLQLINARYTAMWAQTDPSRARAVAARLSQFAVGIGIVLGVAMLLLARPAATYLRLPSPMPLLLVAAILLTSFCGPTLRGRLQGLHRFGAFSVAVTSEYAVRVLVAIVLVAAGLREAGALGGILMGGIATAGAAWWLGRDCRSTGKLAAVPWAEVIRWTIPAILVQCAMSLLLYVDTLLAKHFFSPLVAGEYAGLATTARMLAYASGALGAFVFPIAAQRQRHGHGRVVMHAALALVLCMDVAFVIIAYVDPTLLMHLIVGSQYDQVSGYLAPLALALGAYGIVSLLITYMLATATRLFWVPLVAAPILEVLLLSVFHGTLIDFIRSIDAVLLASLAILAYVYCLPMGRGRMVAEEWNA